MKNTASFLVRLGAGAVSPWLSAIAHPPPLLLAALVCWTQTGLTDRPGHDYNLFWPPQQVVELINLVADELKAGGLNDMGVTPGETTNSYRWGAWSYADAIADDAEALRKLGLVTTFFAVNENAK